MREKKAPMADGCEYWLLLHLEDTTRGDLLDGAVAKRAVKEALGRDYSTNEKVAREVMPSFMELWPEAVIRARRERKLHADANTPSQPIHRPRLIFSFKH
jgi:hypothetical protein